MTKWILAAALIVSALQSIPIAQSKDTLVGSWKLISSKDMTEKGEVRDSLWPESHRLPHIHG